MQAIELREPRAFHFIDIPEPTPPGPGDVTVQVQRVGICGSDISGYLGKMPFYSYPRIPGHELGVEVLAVGDGVTHLQVGDRCSVEPYINQPDSYASRRGHSNCCNQLQVLGVHTDGGLRQRFNLPARKLHPGGALSWEQLALVETLAIGCHAVDRAQPLIGDPLLVIGAGPIGLSVLEFARLAGARITVLDLTAQRLAFCQQHLGVDHTVQVDSAGEFRKQLEEITSGNFYPVVIDATGHHESMSQAVEFLSQAGKLVYVGITTQEVHFPHKALHVREASVLASRNALPGDFTRIIGLIESGEIDTTKWITHRVPFRSLIGEFEHLIRPETGVIKAVVEMEP